MMKSQLVLKRFARLCTLSAALFLAACGGDSSLPTATGKGTIRAINAITSSSDVGFLIEEQIIDVVPYRGISPFTEYDDLDYTFNFEVFFAGDTANTRIISQQLDVAADQDYTYLISGSVASPVLTLWEIAESQFDANSTDFRVRFAHSSASLGAVDYYFAADGVAPVLGEQVASLTFGEITDPVNLEAGPFVLTITAAGDPAIVLYSSSPVQFVAQSDFIVSPFDGGANDNAPYIARGFSNTGVTLSMLDTSFAATVEFLHGSPDLGATDIYDDETLMSQLVATHEFAELSAAVPIAAGSRTFRYTPAGDTATVLLEGTISVTSGFRYRVSALGESGAFVAASSLPDRRPIETAAKLLLYQTTNNFDSVSFYAVPPSSTIDDELPIRSGLIRGEASNAVTLAAGSYDLFVTEFGDTAILAGPVRIDIALGDVVDTVVFDTVDPAVLDLQILSGP